MRSNHVKEQLSAYVDGELTAAEQSAVSGHLQVCEECRDHLASLRRTVTLVQTLEPVRAPDGFQAQVRAGVERLAARPSQAVRWPALRWSWRTAGAAAAVLLIGVFTVNVMRGQRALGPVSPTLTEGVGREKPGADSGLRREASQRTGPVDILALRRVIRTAELYLEVDQFDAATRRLLIIAESADGFIANSSYGETGGVPQGSFTLRVPTSRFATVVDAVEQVGTVLRRGISGQDVTEEFVDLQARVRNFERHEQRLLSFMDRAGKVSELLAIEQELARVRGEIEQLTGRVRFLSHQVDLATIEVGVRQKAKKTSGALWDVGGTLDRMRAAFVATIQQLLAVVEKAAVFASAMVPVLLVGAAAWLLIRRIRRAPA